MKEKKKQNKIIRRILENCKKLNEAKVYEARSQNSIRGYQIDD